MCRDGEVDQLLLLAKTHDDDASRASRAAGHTRNRRANDGSRIGDHHDIVLVGDGGNAREHSALLGQVVAGDAVASAVLHQAEVGKGRALAKAVLGDAEQILALVHHANACNVIALAQLDAAHAACRASHCADVALGEADGLPLCGSDHQIAFALGGNDVDQLVALVQIQSDLSASALVLVLGEQRSLDDALLCDHRQIGLLVEGVHADAGRDLLALGHLENVDDILSLCGSARLGDQVGLAHLHFSCIGEHHEVGVAVDGHDLLNVVLLLGGHADDALASAVLCGIGVGRLTLDISRVRQGNDAAVTLDQILQNDLLLGRNDLGPSLVVVAVANGGHLVLDDLLDLAHVGKNGLQLCDQIVQTEQLILDLAPLHSRQLAERHLHDGLRLQIRKTEALHQGQLGLGDRGRGLHDLHDLVDVVQSDLVSLVDMRLCLGLIQLVLRAADDDLLLVCDIQVENGGKAQHLGLVVDQGQHIDGEGVLELGVLVELIEQDLRIDVAAVLHHDAHSLASRFVAKLGDALDLLLLDALGDGLAEQALVDAVGDLGEDDASLLLLDLGLGAHHDVSLTRGVGLLNAVDAVDGGVGREVGTLDVLHQIGHGAIGIVHAVDGGVDDFSKVVRRNVGRHTDGDTHGAVDQKVRKTRGQDGGLLQTVIEVWHHGNDVLVQVSHHFVRDAVQTRLGITVGSRAVTVHRAEVSVSLDQRIPHGEILRHAHHRAVNGGVAVGMVAAKHVTNGGCRLAEGLGMHQSVLVHGVENAAGTGLHAVPHVGKRARHDDRHRVLDEGFFDLLLHLHVHDPLVFKQRDLLFSLDVLVLLICHFFFLSFQRCFYVSLICLLVIGSVLNADKLAARDPRGLAGGDDDLAVADLARKVIPSRGVKLGEDVVKQEDGIFSKDACRDLSLGQLHGERQGSLLPL